MTLEKEEDDWLRLVDDFQLNLGMACTTKPRKDAWERLPEERRSLTSKPKEPDSPRDNEKSKSSFHGWWQLCLRLKVIVPMGRYRKAMPAHPENSRGIS